MAEGFQHVSIVTDNVAQSIKETMLGLKPHGSKMYQWTQHAHLLWVMCHEVVFGFQVTLWVHLQEVLMVIFD